MSAGCVRSIDIQGDRVSVQLERYAAGLFRSGWAQMLAMAIEGLEGVNRADVQVDCGSVRTRRRIRCRHWPM